MLDIIEGLVRNANVPYAEVRFHDRTWNKLKISSGELEEANTTRYCGTGIRVLFDGAWGFSSTNRTSPSDLKKTLEVARKAAVVASKSKKEKVKGLSEVKCAEGVFKPVVNDPLENHSLEEKMGLIREIDRRVRKQKDIKSALCYYREILDHKFIATSDGARAETFDSKPEFAVAAIAGKGSELESMHESVGVTGGWKDVFGKKDPYDLADKAAKLASRLLRAKHPKGERATVILDPSLVGLISHEAIGHTVEADFVLAGDVVSGKLGRKVASELVTMVDEGFPSRDPHAGGSMLVDDEGTPAQKTVVIDKGVLRSYLHNKESARIFGVPSTGNARAFEYSDEPIIRMRNTYIEPGDWKLEEMIKSIDSGYLLNSGGGGQADANAEFMFQVQEAYRIEKGEVGELLKGVTISGQAFDVLQSVDAIGRDFGFDMGSGYCGKFQMAKVDGGGAPLRCNVIMGGRQ